MRIKNTKRKKTRLDVLRNLERRLKILCETPKPADHKYLSNYQSALLLLENPQKFATEKLQIGQRSNRPASERKNAPSLVMRPESYSFGPLTEVGQTLIQLSELMLSLKEKGTHDNPDFDPRTAPNKLSTIFNQPQKAAEKTRRNVKKIGIPVLLTLMIAEGLWWFHSPKEGTAMFCAITGAFAALCNLSKISALGEKKIENEMRAGGWDQADKEMMQTVVEYSQELQTRFPLAKTQLQKRIKLINAHDAAYWDYTRAKADLDAHAARRQGCANGGPR